jgi:hypothetical protein
MLPDLTPITREATADPPCRFTALAHYLNEEFLEDTWLRMNPRATAGIDRQTVEDCARSAYRLSPIGCYRPPWRGF